MSPSSPGMSSKSNMSNTSGMRFILGDTQYIRDYKYIISCEYWPVMISFLKEEKKMG